MFIAFVVGATVSLGLNITPSLAIGGAVGISVVSSFLPKQAGIMPAVFLKEAFLSELVQTLNVAIDGSFLKGIQDLSSLVDNDKIKWNKIGTAPGVTFGSVSYPIPAQVRVDSNGDINLLEIRTEPTSIPETELQALPYDKKSSVFKQHKESLIEGFFKWSLHALCVDVDAAKKPVIETTGENDGTGRLRLTVKDVINIRTRLDKIGVGLAKLILTADHVGDLRLADQTFARQYHDIQSGNIVPMYGFEILQHVGYHPVFDNVTLTKKAFDAAPAGDDRNASVIIYPKNSFKALGSVSVYHDKPTALMETHYIKNLAHFISGHLDNLNGNAALIDGRI